MIEAKNINDRFLQAISSLSKESADGRITRGMIAKKVGISSLSNLSRLANQKQGENRSVTIEQCARLCQEFGISPEWLLLGIGEIMDEPKVTPPKLTEQVEELNRIVINLVKRVAVLEKHKMHR